MALSASYDNRPDPASTQELGLRKALFFAEEARTRLREYAVNLRALRQQGKSVGWHQSKRAELRRLAYVLHNAELDVEAARFAIADWSRRGGA